MSPLLLLLPFSTGEDLSAAGHQCLELRAVRNTSGEMH
jgi:hypothetical protein